LLLSVRLESRAPLELGKTFLCGLVAMIAAMSYPTFLLYWPSLLLVSLGCMTRHECTGVSPWWRTWHALSALAGLAVPLIIASAYLVTPKLLFWDPANHYSGLFRGGGVVGFNPSILLRAVAAVLRDLLVGGHSYYFEVTHPDFSGPLAIVGLCCVGVT